MAEVLFFVIDSKTRAISSMIEVAYLVGKNPLLLRLFLDHDIILYFKTTLNKVKKKNKLSLKYF